MARRWRAPESPHRAIKGDCVSPADAIAASAALLADCLSLHDAFCQSIVAVKKFLMQQPSGLVINERATSPPVRQVADSDLVHTKVRDSPSERGPSPSPLAMRPSLQKHMVRSAKTDATPTASSTNSSRHASPSVSRRSNPPMLATASRQAAREAAAKALRGITTAKPVTPSTARLRGAEVGPKAKMKQVSSGPIYLSSSSSSEDF